jgi:integrase/recombinase XerD
MVAEFLNSQRAQGNSPSTIRWYRSLLGRFAKTYKEVPESPGAIEGFLGGVDASSETRHAFFRAIKAFYTWYSRRQGPSLDPRIKKLLALGVPINKAVEFINPIYQIKAPKIRKKLPYYLSAAELAWLLVVSLSPRDRALILLLLDTGIRIGEAFNLTREDIEDDTILVDGKTGQREVPISPGVRELLLNLVSGGYVFLGTKGRLGYTGARNIVKKAFMQAGIQAKKWGPHTLRHTFGRQYLMAGGDLGSLQLILGHSNIKTTKIYAELDIRDITIRHRKYSPLHTAQDGYQGLLWTREHTPLPQVNKN